MGPAGLHPVVVAASSPANDLSALVRRIMIAFPPGSHARRRAYVRFVERHQEQLVGRHYTHLLRPHQLLVGASRQAKGRIKKGILLLDRVRKVARHQRFSFFTKREKLQKDDLLLPPVNPRGIGFDREDCYVELKCFIQPEQHYIEQLWDGTSGIFFLAGRNVDAIDLWFNAQVRMGRKIAYSDMRTFDLSQHEDFQAAVIGTYVYHGMPPDLAAMRAKQVGGKLTTRWGYECQTKSQLMSGVADTCLANSETNVFSTLFALMRLNPQWNLTQLLLHISLCVLGDDNILFYDNDVRVEGLEAELRMLGLEPKLVLAARMCTDPAKYEAVSRRWCAPLCTSDWQAAHAAALCR